MKPRPSRYMCCVCGKNKRTHPGIKLHLFPTDAKRRQPWLQALNISYLKKTQSICEDHFEARYVSCTGRLVATAVPKPADQVFMKELYEEDIKPVTKEVGTDMLEVTATTTTVKLPQYDSFGTEFGMVPNPFESGDTSSPQPEEVLHLPLSPRPDHVIIVDDDDNDVCEDPLSASPQPLTKSIDIVSVKDKVTGTPKIVVRQLHHYFTDVEMLTIAQGVEKRTNVILGKLDVKNTTATKNSAWEELTKEVNAVSQIKRTPKEISEKFHLMRITLKKKLLAASRSIEGKSDDDPTSQGVWTEWEKILLRLPRPTNNMQTTGVKNLPSTSGTIKKSDQTSPSDAPNVEESNGNNDSFGGDSDSDSDSLPPTYSGSGNKAVIVIDGEEHEVRIFDAPTDEDSNRTTRDCISDNNNKNTNTAAKEIQSITTKQTRNYHNKSKAGNNTMMAEFLRAQDEMRDLLEDLVKAQQESTTATQRAAAAINQCAQAQIASAEAVRASASALTTLASSMKDWLQRHPQRRKM